jgi:tetratricopeptide (TPR) repeat protein
MGKDKITTLKTGKKSGLTQRQINWIFILLLAAVTFGLYGITARNYYNLDDFHIARDNPDIEQGIKAVPKIFTSLYSNREGRSYGYRPLVRTTFAIEYEFFGRNPYVSHVINTLLYFILVLVLFRVLKRLLHNYHIFFPFLIALLFAAHPIHTEVVASLKNRDEILMLMLCLVSLDQLLSYVRNHMSRHLVWALIWFLLAFLAKPTAAAFFLIFPLALYFFTEADKKLLIRAGLFFGGIGIVAALGPFLYLPFIDRPLDYFENPLVGDPSLANRIAWGGFSLLYYLRLIIFPHPLRYYYGYNMFPDVSITNIWVILGIVVHLGLFIYAIYKFKDRHILSFAILVYLSAIAMFINTVKPVPGIIGERYLWIPSIGFSIALAFFIYKVFLASPKANNIASGKMAGIIVLSLLILIPYSGKTYIRNTQWKTEYTLFAADMPHLWDSFIGNDQYAHEIMQAMNKELAKPVNVVKFIDPQIREALMHWERAREIYPDHYSTYNNMGIVYSRVYKEYDTAIVHFNQALERKPDDPMLLFNLGMAYEGKEQYTRAINFYQKSLDNDPDAINTRSRLANIYFGLGEFTEAIEMNQEIMRVAPGESLPYVNIGNYYIFQRDTTNGIRFYEKAVELGAPPEASIFLSKYFMTKGDIRKSNYYKKIADDLRNQQ